MQNQCYTAEAKSFENKLKESGISYNQFVTLHEMFHALTLSAKAEVNDILKVVKD